MRFLITAVVAMFLFAASTARTDAREMLVPIIDGEWWQVAGDPDLGEYTRPGQQPVDFAVWQAADGTWQLWSCIRRTGCGGNKRVFHRWEGRNLTDTNWKPMGIAMEGKPELGEMVGGMQAPHVVRHDGLYVMAYGDCVNICFATSKDGKHFERVIQPNGKTGVFSEGRRAMTRDPMMIKIDGLWHCYYTAFTTHTRGRGYAYCRTSPDLKTWSDSFIVSYGGRVGSASLHNECPHVVEVEPGLFYFFRNQYYGEKSLNWVYRSNNPRNFGVDNDLGFVRTLRVAAPEIIRHEGRYYMASLMKSLKGIKIAPLKWIKLPELGDPVFDLDSAAERERWRIAEGNLAAIFTQAKGTGRYDPYDARTKYVISTGETPDGEFDESKTGIIESPVFTIEHESYILLASGGRDEREVYVALTDAETGKELTRLSGPDDTPLQRYILDCQKWQGKAVRLRIVDQSRRSWGHINFGGLYNNPLNDYKNRE
ncbi:MAG: hypothetical protein GX621_03270 [Pirellulaceae bacterium]|nr:hypothetical protein [Pirellulaceae bacterium]